MNSSDEKEPKKLFTHPRWHEIPAVQASGEKVELTEDDKEKIRQWKEDLAKQGIVFDDKKEKE